MLKQLDQLSGAISGQVNQQLHAMRHDWRKGRRASVRARVQDIKNHDTWTAITAETKGQILRFEATLELQISGDVQTATQLTEEARAFAPTADDSRIRALIALKEHGTATALKLVNVSDIDDVNLKAALLLESGDLDAAREVLEITGTNFEPNAETYRLRALVSLLTKDVTEAIRSIQIGKEQEPEWVSIKHAGAVIDYLAALSPAALPDWIISWPPPVPWSLLKGEDEAIDRLRSAAENFKEIAAGAEDEERLEAEAWLLACLGNDPDRQGDAADYCKELLATDPTHYPAIAWALARKYPVDLEASLNALEESVEEGSAEIPHIISLADCYVKSDRPDEAVQLLQRTRDVFPEHDATLWMVLQSRALAANGDFEKALALASGDSGLMARQALSLVLRSAAESTGEWAQLVTHLENSYKETSDPIFLLELCESKAEQEDWTYITAVGEELVDAIQTAEAVRLAATALFNSNRKRECLDLLDGHRQLFQEGKLTSQMRRMRASCQSALGMLPEAITESEALVDEDPTTNNLLHLADSYATMGDLKRLAVTARKLIVRPDLAPESSLRLARLLVHEDRELATSLWRYSARSAPDEIVVGAVSTGHQLGLDADPDHRQLLARLGHLAAEGKEGVRAVPFEEIVDYAREYRDQTNKLEEAYRSGTGPVHVITQGTNVPLAEIYYGILRRNQTSPDPLRQSPIFVRYGGRPAEGPSLSHSQPQRLNMDITAVLMAEYVGLLRQMEAQSNQLRIPHSLIPALLEMREKAAPYQPSKLAVFEEIAQLVNERAIAVTEVVLPTEQVQDESTEALGADWIALFELARSSDGYLVDYLPLKSLRGNDVAPPFQKALPKRWSIAGPWRRL